MSEFPAVLALSSLNGRTGFRLDGTAFGDRSGVSISSAGDVNRDGFDDLIVGAYRADPNDKGDAGSSYVVFGKATGFSANLNLSSLNGSDGFRLDGVADNDRSGVSVSSAGDVNRDGFDDLIVGALFADPNGYDAGSSYVVFGKAGDFGASINLVNLNGSNGFRLDGAAGNDFSGHSVSSAGDVNGDGFDDIIVGAYGTDPNGISYAGSSYVVFGRAGGFTPITNLSSLNGSNGFRLDGVAGRDFSGFSVSSAGDVNGDGFDDIIVGAYLADPNGQGDAGSSYVVFGKASAFAPVTSLSSLNGSNGFRLDGVARSDNSGVSVSTAGDVNSDGFDDLIVGANGADLIGVGSVGSSYVVFGRAGGFGANLSLSSLNGSNGFRLDGVATSDRSGFSVSSAGDVNGDGFDDLIVGAYRADPNDGNSAGASYVVFGRAGGFSASLSLASLDGSNGFRLDGDAYSRSGFSVSSAGDINGDGFDDLIVGAPFANPNDSTDAGSSYVIFGRAPDAAVARTGTGIANTIRGGAFNDRIDGKGGADTMIGGAGADVYLVDNPGDRVVELASDAGTDTVLAVCSFSLDGTGAENLILAGTAVINGLGNALANALTGNAAANILNGGAGADTMTGGAGSDTYVVENAGDRCIEANGAAGVDTVLSTTSYSLAGSHLENLTLVGPANIYGLGNSIANTITGNGGANLIDGMGGRDTLTGNGGADTFLFRALADSTVAVAGRDRITDFSRAQGDRIDLSLIDANANLAGDQGFGFIGTSAFSGQAGQLRYQFSGGDTLVSGDVNGDRAADFTITLAGNIALQQNGANGDFIL